MKEPYSVVRKDTLIPITYNNGPLLAHIFDGTKHDGEVNVSMFIVDCPPQTGPPVHKHPYEEVFVLVEGEVRYETAGEIFDGTTDDIVIVPPGVPHKFTNIGTDQAKMVNVHASPEVIIDFE